jgi:hypothetical protein
MASSPSIQSVLAADQKLSDGYTKHAADVGNLVVGSQTFMSADIQAHVKLCADTQQAAEAARGALHEAVAAAKKARADSRPMIAALKQLVLIRFKDQDELLADFGLQPKKPRRKLTSDEKAAAAALGKSTRKARGTMGTRQKAKVKGGPAPVTPPAVQPAPAHTPPTPPSASGAGPNGHA